MTDPKAEVRTDPRDRAVDALMALAATRDWHEIELADVARRAGLSLGELRASFPSKGAILGALSRRFDLAVLKEDGEDMAGENPRDRLFDVLMRRIDAMTPYKDALRRIVPAIERDPAAAAAMNSVALNSQRYMLAAAGIRTEDALGTLKVQGLVLAFVRTLHTWFDDDDPGLARTMAKLDEELRRGETILKRADDVRRLASPFVNALSALAGGMGRSGRRRSARRRPDDGRYTAPDDMPVYAKAGGTDPAAMI